jgi:hypothetical protein
VLAVVLGYRNIYCNIIAIPTIAISTTINRTASDADILAWKHMPGPIDTIHQQEGSEAIYWCCKYCPKEHGESGGTAFIAVHLQTIQEIVDSQEPQNTLQQ